MYNTTVRNFYKRTIWLWVHRWIICLTSEYCDSGPHFNWCEQFHIRINPHFNCFRFKKWSPLVDYIIKSLSLPNFFPPSIFKVWVPSTSNFKGFFFAKSPLNKKYWLKPHFSNLFHIINPTAEDIYSKIVKADKNEFYQFRFHLQL